MGMKKTKSKFKQLLCRKNVKNINCKYTYNIYRNIYKLVKKYDIKYLANDRFFMLKTLMLNNVEELPWTELFSRSEFTGKNSYGLDSLILKYGKTLGNRLYSERSKMVSNQKNAFIEKNGADAWKKLSTKKISNRGLDGYILKYGKIDGTRRWNDYLSKWKASMYKKTSSGTRKNGSTLAEMQQKWGVKEGYRRWKNRINGRKRTLSLIGFLERFGPEVGIIKYKEYVDKMLSNLRGNRLGGYSKVSQRFFWSVYNNLTKQQQSCCKFYELNNEEKFYITKNNTVRLIYVDFKCKNVIVEFDGEYWHKNTKKEDEERDVYLNKRGYTVLRIKELEYKQTPQHCIEKCINLIKEKYETAHTEQD